MEATMTVLSTYPRIAAGLAAGAIVGLFMSGAAQAITENIFRYSRPQTGSYSIHPASLSPQHLDQPLNFFIGDELVTNNIRCFQTGVNLPDGATLTNLQVWYKASTTTQFGPMDFRLFRTALGSGAGRLIGFKKAVIISGDRATESIALSGADAIVHNRQFMYGFSVCMYVVNPDAAFGGARLTYTYTTAGD
jgi:hypothetical protein